MTIPPSPDADRRPGPVCPAPVLRAGSRHRWEDLTFLHWAYEPGEVQQSLAEFADTAWLTFAELQVDCLARL